MNNKFAVSALTAALLLGVFFLSGQAGTLIGVADPETSWDASGSVTVTASSSYLGRVAVNTVNGSGVAYGINLSGHEDIVHDREPTNMWLSGTFDDSAANPAPAGTVGGKHWIHFAFDRLYKMEEMWIWNYCEDYWGNYGMKAVTVEYASADNPAAGNWTTVFAGNLVLTSGASAAGFPTSHETTIPFGQTPVKHIVITSANSSWNFFPAFLGYEEVGLAEVQFYAVTQPANCAEVIAQGLGSPMDTNLDCYVNMLDLAALAVDWLNCMAPEDSSCSHSWD